MTAQRKTIEAELRDFIDTVLLDEPYEESDPLEDGAVDSLQLEQLIDYIGEQYGVSMADEEMVRENFESVRVLAALVESKLDAEEA